MAAVLLVIVVVGSGLICAGGSSTTEVSDGFSGFMIGSVDNGGSYTSQHKNSRV